MFTKLPTYTKYSKEVITIQQLHNLVKNNPQKDRIEYLRTLVYKSTEYKQVKKELSCIMPHGTFNYLCKDDINKLSGYLYYDIDGIDNIDELNDTISTLIDTFPISYLHKSVSNKGLHFLVKYDVSFFTPNVSISELNVLFSHLQNYVFGIIKDKGFNLDSGAKNLERKMIISSDEDAYLNNNVSFSIDNVLFNNFILNNSNTIKIVKGKNKSTSKLDITPNVSFSIIPINELNRQIKTQTQYVKEIKGDYVIEDMEYYTILIPEFIKDGTKHRLYVRIVNALYFINGSITREQVLSYLFYINNRASPPMDSNELFRFINNLCNHIETTGEIKLKPRIKKIHFNKNSNLDKKQKQSMGAQITGKSKNNNTIKKIMDARIKLLETNQKDTRVNVAKLTGLSLKTVQRNWDKKELNNLNDIKIPIKKTEQEKDTLLITEEINEDNFLNEETIIKEEIVQPEEDNDFWEGFTPKHIVDVDEIYDKDYGDSKGIIGLIETYD